MPDCTRTQSASLSDDVEVLAQRLRRLLTELDGVYERLESLGEQRVEAVERSDLAALATTLAAENECVQRIGEIEKCRLGVVGFLSERLGASPGDGDPTIEWVAGYVRVDATRERLLDAGLALRERIERVQRRNASSRQALESLAAHMQGLLASATASLSHTGAYGRAGRVVTGPAVVSAMDLTT